MAYTDTVLTAGTNGFYVDGTLFPLGSVALSMPSSSVAALTYVNKVGALTTMKPVGYYKDSGGTPFNQTTLTAFYTDHMTSSGGTTITSGISDPMSAGLVEVTCANVTSASIIGFSPIYNGAYATGIGGFMVRPLSGKFRIYYMNGDGAADGLTFMWYLIKP